VLCWVWFWPAIGDDLAGDLMQGMFAGGLGALLGWFATDRGRWTRWGAIVVGAGAAVPASLAMFMFTRRVDPALAETSRTALALAPVVFVVAALQYARRSPSASERVPADAWLAAVVAGVVVSAASFAILNTVGRPMTAQELLCARFDDWAEVRSVTVGGSAEIRTRQEFFATSTDVVPTPEQSDRSDRMLRMSYRIDANMSPGGDPSQLEASERALQAEMALWRAGSCPPAG
jgi:hypothetical protein